MIRYPHFDPCLVGQRNEEIEREVRALRLEARLREHSVSRGSRLVAFAKRGVLLLPRAAQLRWVTAPGATLGRRNGLRNSQSSMHPR
jgi:hypothetical protein